MRLILFFFFFAFSALANPWAHLGQGDQTAQDFLNKIEEKKSEAGGHPFHNGQIPSEASFTDVQLAGRAQSIIHQDPASQMVHQSSDRRTQFKIDPQTDLLMIGAQKVMETPLTEIGGKETQVFEIQQGGGDETFTCEEPGEDTEHTCKSTLMVDIKEELGPLKSGTLNIAGPTIYHSYGYLLNAWPKPRKKHFVGHISVDEGTLKAFISQQTTISLKDMRSASVAAQGGWVKVRHKHYTFQNFAFTYTHQPIIKTPVYSWTEECGHLEEKVDQGLCSYGSKICTQGKQTRIIQGVPVTQDCWEYTFTYICSYPAKDECGPLRARGCIQTHSSCKQTVANKCVVYSQTYQCKGNKQTRYQITGGQTPFCLDGNCRDQSYDANDEMMSSLAQLSLLKEMQGQIQNGTIFKGEDNRCSKYILSFKDCCGSGKGWGNSLGLSSCSAAEKNLSKKRQARLCHYVGTFCAKKVLGKCIKKRSTYCCFGNKLLKAFHEQGRPQIGMGWGEPKHPLCRGFTVDEIQRIDFSKLDLTEVFEDLMRNFNPGKMQNIGKQVGERLETIKKSLTPNLKKSQKQGDSA